MTIETIPIRVQHKRMTASEWQRSNLILLQGELGVETDTGRVKVGDGTNRFSSLKYLTGPQGERGAKGDKGEKGDKGADGVVTFASLTQQQKDSLRGAQGPQGPQGVAGARGPQGERGIQGVQGIQGIQGTKGDRGASIYSSSYSGLTANRSGCYITDLRPSVSINDLVIGSLVVSPNGDIFAITSKNASSSPHSFGVGPLLANIKGANGAQGPQGVAGARGADGKPGQNIVNQNGGQQLKYWIGTEAEYNRISNKDNNTIYDIYK